MKLMTAEMKETEDTTSIARFQELNWVLSKANSGRGTGSNDIPCSEGSTLRKSLDQSGNREDKIACRRILAFFAIHKRLHAKIFRQVFGWHSDWSLFPLVSGNVDYAERIFTMGQKVSADFPI